MNKQVFLCLCCTLLALTTVSAKEEYRTDHFIISSDLRPAYVKIIQANAEAYYANMLPRYFKKRLAKTS